MENGEAERAAKECWTQTRGQRELSRFAGDLVEDR
jgi:hypothetical protein